MCSQNKNDAFNFVSVFLLPCFRHDWTNLKTNIHLEENEKMRLSCSTHVFEWTSGLIKTKHFYNTTNVKVDI